MSTRSARIRRLLSATLFCSASLQAQRTVSAAEAPTPLLKPHWVTTWAMAQQLLATPPNPGEARDRTRFALPANFADETIRMNLRTTIAGKSVRLKLANASGNKPTLLDDVHVALSGDQPGEIKAGTDHKVTFEGNSAVTIPPGVTLISDPIDMEIQPQTYLSVSIYAQHETGLPTNHMLGSHTALIGKGDLTAETKISDPVDKTFGYLWLAGIDVDAPAQSFAVVAFGDSITDGFGSTVDKDNTWPALFAKRLQAASPNPPIAVLNEGISGNQVLQDGAGVSALARFDRDVLGQSGVRWIILLEGINDINLHTRITPGIDISSDDLTAEKVIAGYKQLILRAHAHEIQVMGATLTPEEGISIASVRGEQLRNELNAWIRTSGYFDAVVDFDKAIRDEAHPKRIREGLDSDHIHPSDAGYQIMADSIPTTPFLLTYHADGQTPAAEELPPLPAPIDKQLRVDWANLGRYKVANEQLPPPRGLRVVFIGDSITDIWAQNKEQFFPGKDYIGRGIGGQTTPQMLVRFQQDVVHLKPSVVVINGGTNDIAGNTGPSSLAMIEDNLAAMVQLAHINKIKVVLASVTPAGAYPWRPTVKPAETIVELNAWMKDFCARNQCTYADYFSSMSDADHGMKSGLSVDGVHPTPQGYAMMAPIVESAIHHAVEAKGGQR